MKQGGRLKTYTQLRRHTPLRQESSKRAAAREAGVVPHPKRAQPAVPARLRVALKVRSGGRCEISLIGCLGPATDPAHRLARKAGGRRRTGRKAVDRLSAVMHSCRLCHDWSEARPRESYELGLKIREGQIPAQEPVVYRGKLAYLTDDGHVVPFEAVGA
jgi:hypothetical protein